MSFPVLSADVRALIETVMPLRRKGMTTKEIAAELKMGVSSLYERMSRRSIMKHCPDLYRFFVESLPQAEKKEAPPDTKSKKYADLLCEGLGLAEAYTQAVGEHGPKAANIVRNAMKLAYKNKGGAFFAYADGVLQHKILQVPPPTDSLDIFAVFVKRTKLKKFCEICGRKGSPLNKLTVFCMDKEKGAQTFCRACLCADQSDESPLETILINHQHQSADNQSVYHYW